MDTDLAVRRVVEEKPDLIFAANLGYVIAAHKLTKTIPIVMWISGFPIEGGVATSLARPGKNVTGLTIYAGAQVFGKLVQLLLEAKPGVRRVGALCTYVPPFHPSEEAEPIMQEIRDAGRSLGIDVRLFVIAKPEQTTDALARIAAERMEALLLTSGASTVSRRQEIMRFALERRLPTITDFRWFGIEPQPLINYGAVPGLLIRQASTYVDRILWGGAKPGDLPIQLPSKFELIINLKTAKALELTIPQSLLGRADEVIQ
jgi:putative ABC transport system substrate-binding protein